MDSIAGSLAGEISYEQIHPGLVTGRVLIYAFHEIAGAQYIKSVPIQLNHSAVPVFHLVGEGRERQAFGNNFRAATCLQQDGGQSDHCGGEREAQCSRLIHDSVLSCQKILITR